MDQVSAFVFAHPFWVWLAVGAVGFLAIPWYAGYRGAMAVLPAIAGYCHDQHVPVVCYPRNCDAVSFYVERDDLRSFRSKETHLLIADMLGRPRTVVHWSARLRVPSRLRGPQVMQVKHDCTRGRPSFRRRRR